MYSLNIFAVLLIFTADYVFAGEPRIINGIPAKVGQFPHQVSIQLDHNNFHFCGGSILDDKNIVTAAHCVHDLPKDLKIKVWAGGLVLQRGGTYSSVKHIFKHEKYNNITHDYDIAVLRLDKPLKLDNNTNAIKLPTGNVSDETTCFISGWGETVSQRVSRSASTNLLYTDVSIFNWAVCSKVYSIVGVKISQNMICAWSLLGHDSCQGDSGGPLMCKIKSENDPSLVGIVSFGIGCGQPGVAGVYTNVLPFKDWIKEQIKRNSAISLHSHSVAFIIATTLYTIFF